MGGCQNYGPCLDPYYHTAPYIQGTIILTTTHITSFGCSGLGVRLGPQGAWFSLAARNLLKSTRLRKETARNAKPSRPAREPDVQTFLIPKISLLGTRRE